MEGYLFPFLIAAIIVIVNIHILNIVCYIGEQFFINDVSCDLSYILW